MLVVPLPSSGVNRLADRTQQAQARQVVALGVHGVVGFRSLDERADGCGRGVKDRDLVVLDHFPETARVGIGGDAFEHDFGAAQSQWAIGDVSVARDPADVGGAPEHVVCLQVEGPLCGQGRVQQIATSAVLNAFGFAGGAGGVEQEQGVLGTHPLGLAGGGLLVGQIGHPQVAACGHGDVGARALDDQDILDGAATAQIDGVVHDGFEGQQLAATHLVVGGDHGHRAGVFDAVAQRLG